MDRAAQKIPDSLIYEMVDGKAIYYRGFKDYLSGNKSLEELMGSSKIQSFLATELVFLLKTFLGKEYFIFSNELGLQFSKRSWRAADIAVIERDKVGEMDGKYLSVAPKYVIEIDTKADLNEVSNPFGYYQEKTQELLKFGVQRVTWVFTDTQKVMLAQRGLKKWEIIDWDEDIEFVDGLAINIKQILIDNHLIQPTP
ncbi:MAG: Uma2 family endonuclease [Bacteroidota bacterium]